MTTIMYSSPLKTEEAATPTENSAAQDGGQAGGGGGGTEPDPNMDMPRAMRVIINNAGRKVSSKAQQVAKDSYMGYLLLRHLRIRDLRTKVSCKPCTCLYYTCLL